MTCRFNRSLVAECIISSEIVNELCAIDDKFRPVDKWAIPRKSRSLRPLFVYDKYTSYITLDVDDIPILIRELSILAPKRLKQLHLILKHFMMGLMIARNTYKEIIDNDSEASRKQRPESGLWFIIQRSVRCKALTAWLRF